MHDAALVAELQPNQQIVHDADRIGEREPLLPVEQHLQRRTVNELHYNVGEVVGLAVVEHCHDVGMRQPTGRLRLAAEACQRLLCLRIGVVGQADGLDRDAPGDDRIPAFVHSPHGTAAKRPLNFIFAKGLDRFHAAAYRPASDREETKSLEPCQNTPVECAAEQGRDATAEDVAAVQEAVEARKPLEVDIDIAGHLGAHAAPTA